MSTPVIFKELPETFPEHDQYKKPSFVTSIAVHSVLIVGLLVIPFLFMERITNYQLLTVLVSPPPPPAAAPPPPIQIAGAVKAAPKPLATPKATPEALVMPTVVPKEIAQIIDAPEIPEGVIGGVIGGVPGGTSSGIVGSLLARNAIQSEDLPVAAPPPPPPPPPKVVTTPTAPIRVGGDVKEPRIVTLVPPKYPPLASKAHVQGKVVLEATLKEDGTVDAIKVISGHPLLVNAAIDCVKQWRYEPSLLNGQPVAVILTAIVTFSQSPMSE